MKNKMRDIDYLEFAKTPQDELISVLRSDFEYNKLSKNHKFLPFKSYITQRLVNNLEVIKLAKDYITQLISNKDTHGYLYFLNTKKLMIPFNLQFNAELIIDPQHYQEIVNDIQEITKDLFCPIKSNNLYDITLVELLYFFTLFVNPHLNWITVDHILGCVKNHRYLLASPQRILTK